ncbi:MAG: site-specific integrase, partial [Ruminococcus sp.]|nr:site-specific integrase [Ruminococcus sp.]
MSIKGVTKRGENTYRFTVSMGFDENGKHIRRTMTYKLPEGTAPTKAEKMIQRAYNDFEDLCKEPPKVEKGITFKELVD